MTASLLPSQLALITLAPAVLAGAASPAFPGIDTVPSVKTIVTPGVLLLLGITWAGACVVCRECTLPCRTVR